MADELVKLGGRNQLDETKVQFPQQEPAADTHHLHSSLASRNTVSRATERYLNFTFP
jgi:hypothetical protein